MATAEELDAIAVKKRIKAAQANQALHVLWLMTRLNLSKPDATVLAYLDGPLGLEARLNPPAQPGPAPVGPGTK